MLWRWEPKSEPIESFEFKAVDVIGKPLVISMMLGHKRRERLKAATRGEIAGDNFAIGQPRYVISVFERNHYMDPDYAYVGCNYTHVGVVLTPIITDDEGFGPQVLAYRMIVTETSRTFLDKTYASVLESMGSQRSLEYYENAPFRIIPFETLEVTGMPECILGCGVQCAAVRSARDEESKCKPWVARKSGPNCNKQPLLSVAQALPSTGCGATSLCAQSPRP
ncbi:hypothetical protein KM043_013742 [Ampulex compressa]|nr:hypothetical protein KM043_013742 [Ampulex compressa]